MTRQEMQNKLDRKDITGVGVKVTWGDNNVIYYFYEDFEDSKGVDRASKHFANMINKGKVRKAEYIYNQPKRSSERPSKMATCQPMMASRTHIERLKGGKYDDNFRKKISNSD